TPGAATQLVFTTQPASATAGSAFGQQPVVKVEDANGNVVTSGPDAGVAVSMSLASGGGSLQGTTTVTASGGIATFANLRIDTSGAHTISASTTLSIPGAVNRTSNSFTVAPGTATQLVFTTQPGAATAGSPFAQQPVVKIEDAYGNVVTSGPDAGVDIAMTATRLHGTTTVTASAGITTFTTLR